MISILHCLLKISVLSNGDRANMNKIDSALNLLSFDLENLQNEHRSTFCDATTAISRTIMFMLP